MSATCHVRDWHCVVWRMPIPMLLGGSISLFCTQNTLHKVFPSIFNLYCWVCTHNLYALSQCYLRVYKHLPHLHHQDLPVTSGHPGLLCACGWHDVKLAAMPAGAFATLQHPILRSIVRNACSHTSVHSQSLLALFQALMPCHSVPHALHASHDFQFNSDPYMYDSDFCQEQQGVRYSDKDWI